MTAINRQIRELAPVLNSPTVRRRSRWKLSNKAVPVAAMMKQHGGATYVFAVSMKSGETIATFSLAGLPAGAQVEVIGEDRKIQAAAGKFQDAFADWDVHSIGSGRSRRSPGKLPLKKKRVEAEALGRRGLCAGLLAAFVLIIALNYGVLSPGRVQTGSRAWFVVLIAAFLTGYIDTCVGGGHGTLLTPILILLGFAATMVASAVLLSEICIGIVATILNHRVGNIRLSHGEQHRRVLLVPAGCSLVGSFIAVTLAVNAPPKWVNAWIGLIIIAVGILLLAGRGIPREFSMRRIAVLGTIAAFNKGLSGGGYGPLLTSGQLLSGVSEKGAVSITPPAQGRPA